MTRKPKQEDLTEWFHTLAAHPLEDIPGLASPKSIALLRKHVARSVPDFALPHEFSPDQFAKAVLSIRENETAWNRATMSVLIKADNLFKSGQAIAALNELERFASSCPWVSFREVCLAHATHY